MNKKEREDNKVNIKNSVKINIIYTVITLIFFGMLAKVEFATDTYAVFNFNEKEIFNQFASSGRYITAMAGKIIKHFNFSEQGIYLGSYLLAIVCTILSQFKVYKIIEKDVKSKILKYLIPTLIIINPFSIELFLYIEKGIMLLSVLLSIISVEYMIKYFSGKNKVYIFFSIVIMFLAICSYQGTIGIFVSILLVYIIKYSKTWKEFVKNNLIVAGVYGIPAIANYCITKIVFRASRVNGEIIFKQSLDKIYKNTVDMILKTYNILPKYIFILFILFTFACFWCKILEEKKKNQNLLNIAYILFGITIVAILPQFMQSTNSIWFVPRSTYCFASLYGIFLLYLLSNYEYKLYTKAAIIIMSLIFLVLQLNTFYKIEIDRYKVNNQDYEITCKIIEQINEYEKSTGNRIVRGFVL